MNQIVTLKPLTPLDSISTDRKVAVIATEQSNVVVATNSSKISAETLAKLAATLSANAHLMNEDFS